MKEKILELRLNGKSYNEIAEELNCAKSTVHKYCNSNGLNNIGLLGYRVELEIKECNHCGSKFEVKYQKQRRKYCSKKCADNSNNKKILGRLNGIKSASSQQRRSKNEKLFFELCFEQFKNVTHNEIIFNGWDADIILKDYKLAILWNGKWHYEKITEKHSLKQVQNRDKIKINEIQKSGYTPYIIKDMGKYNEQFVKDEFEKLSRYITSLS